MDINPRPTVQQESEDLSISLFDMMDSLSTALDLINPALDDHHKLTCYVTCCIAEEMGLDDSTYNNLFAASVLHDIGAIGFSDRMKLLEFEEKNAHLHGELGAILLSKFPPFRLFADLIKFHHVPWRDGAGAEFRGQPVPMESHLIHLADRIAVLVNRKKPIFDEAPKVRDKINALSGPTFVPEMVDAFLEMSRKEVFWLDFVHQNIGKVLRTKSRLPRITLGVDGLLELSRFYALIIDTRSRFTATHSSGVAATAEKLAQLSRLSVLQSKKVRIAGYLHDIGKLAVPDSILEKNGSLDLIEWRTIRSHTYYTHQILDAVDGLQDIAKWASDHHENLDGDGYPFRHAEDRLPLESRILAVADVFTALSEDRPYRDGMDSGQIVKILLEMVAERKLDHDVVETLISQMDDVQLVRQEAQATEQLLLTDFWEKARHDVNRRARHADS
ncbi:MAG: HD domain-containing protein [Rhodospirillaceae bacterium]|nr:HD domain-containing protein [Rhodospirillaceae bacterium]